MSEFCCPVSLHLIFKESLLLKLFLLLLCFFLYAYNTPYYIQSG